MHLPIIGDVVGEPGMRTLGAVMSYVGQGHGIGIAAGNAETVDAAHGAPYP